MTLDVPYYTPDPDGKHWNKSCYHGQDHQSHTVRRRQLGTFSYSPAFDRWESMINAATGHLFDYPSTTKGVPRSDKTGFIYSNRWRGIGASIGLVQPPFDKTYKHVFTYNYTEIGYDTDVSCTFNSSSQWTVTAYQPEKEGHSPNKYFMSRIDP